MERRDFLNLCVLAGVGVQIAPFARLPSLARAAEATGGFNKFVVLVNASGGWDHSLFVDPKGNVPNADGWFINAGFAPGQISKAGNISYAPVANNKAFFDRFHPSMTVIRGIDAQTASHSTGQRTMWSGRMPDGSPSFAALLAAEHGSKLPLAFITNGGYDSTAGVPVAKTRIGNANALMPALFPNRLSPSDPDSATYHTSDTVKRIHAARQARLETMRERQHLPAISRAQELLHTARLGIVQLKGLNDHLPEDLGAYSALGRQAAIALAAYKAGLSQVATMSLGGFDTHGNNDPSQEQRYATLTEGVTALVNRAEELGIADQLLIVMGSEFGRTPKYNGGDGKDHWTVNANVIIDLSGEIPGNRVIGGTDTFGKNLKINATSLQIDPAGVAITPGHIHQWLRKLTKIDTSEGATTFPVHAKTEINFSTPIT